MPTTTPKALGRAAPKKKAQPPPVGLESLRITLGEHGSYILRDDWTARVSERCRRELGMPPETVLQELLGPVMGLTASKADRLSLDTIVRGFVFAAWQNGAADVSYDDLLDRVTMKTDVKLEPNPEDDSPEV
jgi:hypothetical protein